MKFDDINFKKIPANHSKYILVGFFGWLLIGTLAKLNIFNRTIDNNEIIGLYITSIFFFLWFLGEYINFLCKKQKGKIEWKLLTNMQYEIEENIIINKKMNIIKYLEKFGYINSSESKRCIENISK